MTAHDDDQDLVTIRVPRRAAAMYAAELDVAAAPGMVRLTLYGRQAAGLIAMTIGLVFTVVGMISGFRQDYEDVAFYACVTIICTGVGAFLFLLGRSQMAAARQRKVL